MSPPLPTYQFSMPQHNQYQAPNIVNQQQQRHHQYQPVAVKQEPLDPHSLNNAEDNYTSQQELARQCLSQLQQHRHYMSVSSVQCPNTTGYQSGYSSRQSQPQQKLRYLVTVGTTPVHHQHTLQWAYDSFPSSPSNVDSTSVPLQEPTWLPTVASNVTNTQNPSPQQYNSPPLQQFEPTLQQNSSTLQYYNGTLLQQRDFQQGGNANTRFEPTNSSPDTLQQLLQPQNPALNLSSSFKFSAVSVPYEQLPRQSMIKYNLRNVQHHSPAAINVQQQEQLGMDACRSRSHGYGSQQAQQQQLHPLAVGSTPVQHQLQLVHDTFPSSPRSVDSTSVPLQQCTWPPAVTSCVTSAQNPSPQQYNSASLQQFNPTLQQNSLALQYNNSPQLQHRILQEGGVANTQSKPTRYAPDPLQQLSPSQNSTLYLSSPSTFLEVYPPYNQLPRQLSIKYNPQVLRHHSPAPNNVHQQTQLNEEARRSGSHSYCSQQAQQQQRCYPLTVSTALVNHQPMLQQGHDTFPSLPSSVDFTSVPLQQRTWQPAVASCVTSAQNPSPQHDNGPPLKQFKPTFYNNSSVLKYYDSPLLQKREVQQDGFANTQFERTRYAPDSLQQFSPPQKLALNLSTASTLSTDLPPKGQLPRESVIKYSPRVLRHHSPVPITVLQQEQLDRDNRRNRSPPKIIYRCYLCAKTFPYIEMLNEHHCQSLGKFPNKQIVQRVEDTALFRCSNCQKVLKNAFQLKKHLFAHTLPYVCSYCKMGFGRKSQVQDHIRNH